MNTAGAREFAETATLPESAREIIRLLCQQVDEQEAKIRGQEAQLRHGKIHENAYGDRPMRMTYPTPDRKNPHDA